MMESIADEINLERPKPEEIEKIYKSLDSNNDGRISAKEFMELVKVVLRFMAKNEWK